MRTKPFGAIAAILVFSLSGCSTTQYSKNIAPSSVPTSAYADYNCQQIQAELIRVKSQLNTVSDVQDSDKKKDEEMSAVAWVLFWPAAFMIKNDSHKAEISQLKGEYNTLSQLQISKCEGTGPSQLDTTQANSTQAAPQKVNDYKISTPNGYSVDLQDGEDISYGGHPYRVCSIAPPNLTAVPEAQGDGKNLDCSTASTIPISSLDMMKRQ